jgi:hypothetical protein
VFAATSRQPHSILSHEVVVEQEDQVHTAVVSFARHEY